MVGTSGFDYPHWRGSFYPPDLPAGDRLAYYAARFPCVELNVTFYRMPKEETFRHWAAEVPDEFIFAVKASRYLTHIKRLIDPEDPVERLLDAAGCLGRHLGPFLLQLPPNMEADAGRLDRTLEAFGGARVAVEFRHSSWFSDEVMAVLRSRGSALCLADRGGPPERLERTADWTYVRFHEGRALPPCYSERALHDWRDRLAKLGRETSTPEPGAGSIPDGYAFFNNDGRACAIRDAETFARLLANRDDQPHDS